jgi:transcriptional regulator with XRE-family HTH domain
MRMRTHVVHGEKLRELRVATGVRMQDVADAVGCSWRHLQMIETAGRQPSAELVHRLARELSRLHGRTVTIDEFTSPHEQCQAAA